MALEIRRAVPADVPGIAAVHYAGWNENYRGLMPDEAIDARSVERRTQMWNEWIHHPARVTLAASEDDGIVGFASALVLDPPHQGFDGFLQMLFVYSRVKGRGIGRSLLNAIARELRERGCTNMALRTLRLNPARGFYERMGARLLSGFTYDAGDFDDVAYGFDDLRSLLA